MLTSPPSEIALHFSEATRLTALTIQKEGGEEQQITSVLPKSASAHVNVTLPQMGPGKYVVNWRAVGPDNHVMKGALHFTIEK